MPPVPLESGKSVAVGLVVNCVVVDVVVVVDVDELGVVAAAVGVPVDDSAGETVTEDGGAVFFRFESRNSGRISGADPLWSFSDAIC